MPTYSEVKFKTSTTKLHVSKSFSMEHVYEGNMDVITKHVCTIFKTLFLSVMPCSQAASYHATCISLQYYFLIIAVTLLLSFTQYKCPHFLLLNNTDTTEFYITRMTTIVREETDGKFNFGSQQKCCFVDNDELRETSIIWNLSAFSKWNYVL